MEGWFPRSCGELCHQASFPGFATPYVVAIVETEEGIRLAAGLRGVEPASLRLDLPFEVELVPVSDTVAVPFFSPA
jgi:hypothetical protein